MNRYFLSLLCLLALIAAACGRDNQEVTLPSSTPVEAAFTISPQNPEPGAAITFSVKVTQNGTPVDDAKEVKFEWWKDGQEQHVTIPAALQADGVYTAQQTIDEPGSYFVYYHVTARDFHNMQKVAFTVGDAGQANRTESGHTGHSQPADAPASHQHGEGGDPSGHQASGIDFHFMPPETIQPAQPAALTVHLMKENQILGGATVRFEYWQGDEEKHAFLDAKETQPGQYSTLAEFPSSGSYTVNVHVEKGDIHDHKSFPLTVK